MDEGYIKISKSDNWGTPPEIKDLYKNYFDPCPYKNNFDGLEIEWEQNNFVNPPYSDLNKWCKKINQEAKKGKKIILLIPARTDTKYFHNYILPLKPDIKFIKGRLKFIDLDQSSKKPVSAPFPSLLITIN